MKKITLLLAILSGPAYACDMSDVAGKWNLFFEQASCNLVIANDGKVVRSSCKYGLEDPESIPIKGRLKMQVGCRITGKLRLDYISPFGELSNKIAIGQSRVNLDMGFWTGSLKHTQSDFSAYHTFTAVRLSGN